MQNINIEENILENFGKMIVKQKDNEKYCRYMLKGILGKVRDTDNKIVLYLVKTNQIVTCVRGKGGNLSREDKEEGYVNYVKFYFSDFDGKTYNRGDSGIYLYKMDKEKLPLKELIYDVLNSYYDDFSILFKEFILLNSEQTV